MEGSYLPNYNVDPKLVVKISLLPLHWEEPEFEALFRAIVAAACSDLEMGIRSENDIIVLFPSDRMVKGVGEEIDVEVHTPGRLWRADLVGRFAGAVAKLLEESLPKAKIQVRCLQYGNLGFFSYSPD